MLPTPFSLIELSAAATNLAPGLLEAGGTVASLALLEAVLSADNAVALAGIVQSVALPQRRRRLMNQGLVCAFVLRGLMVLAAVSSIFIRDYGLPNIAGYTPIHLLVPYTLFSITMAFVYLARRDLSGHRKTMQWLYIGSCMIAGAFTLLPNRYLGQLIWGQWLGWV